MRNKMKNPVQRHNGPGVRGDYVLVRPDGYIGSREHRADLYDYLARLRQADLIANTATQGSGGELAAQSQRSQPLAIGNRASVCGEVRLVMQVQRQVFGLLRLDDLNVLLEDLVIEVESLFDGGILVEVAAEGDKEPGLAS